ncbi:hypothetical protein HUK65_18260 [Rhodobacteraceae bacterium 2376]|uniref:Uncharacterized protein n=1 Tax=Rhabdonatronobacter sediminivivens TaxID=2743469 RepID=A0A7Z0L1L4_9RHOB|nr:hypothetical protein [Rhabdonatronobacter sediminivivens]NYS26901.1 hypothetical protein [Rhabdonatronobacter sediminivivens]
MPFNQHIDQINALIEARPINDEFTLNDLFQAEWPVGIVENQHQAFGIWFRRKVAEGRILRVDDIDIPTGKIHNIHYRRVEEGSGQAWVRMSLPRDTWNWIDHKRGSQDRTSFLQNLIKEARSQ